jgi:hypothetical protein
MSEIKSDVKETVKAFIQTIFSIIVKEITKKMIKSLNYLQKKNFEAKIKNLSEEQLTQFLDENPCFRQALENGLKSLDYAKSTEESVYLTEKLRSIFETTSAKDLVGAFVWPAPRMIIAVTIAIILLAPGASLIRNSNDINNTTNTTTINIFNIFNNTSGNTTNVTIFPIANFSSNVSSYGYAPLYVKFTDLS